MIEDRELFERAVERFVPPEGAFDRLTTRRDRKNRSKRIRAAVLAIVVAVAGTAGLVRAFSSGPVPADRSEELGIFAPVASRILYLNDGVDLGYDPGLWAVDPSGPADTTEGPRVADDVASTLVPLGLEDVTPLGWSSDGTELLFVLTEAGLYKELFILHADGSETQLNTGTEHVEGATISPDGSRVVFAAAGGPYFPYNDAGAPGLFVVDTDGGRPVPIPYPSAGDRVSSPTFSPDGTQIAYLVRGFGNDDVHVWVADADGSNAHEILADEPAVAESASGAAWSPLAWSPAGDRIAMANDGIYTFAPDGSDFRTVITDGTDPFWSPDGSQIAYMVPRGGETPAGLAIADADGSDVRAFGYGASGPWHPAG